MVLKNQGKYEEAEDILRRAFRLIDTMLGKEHPLTLTSINNLATVLRSQGKYKKAEDIHRQALRLREMVLSKEYSNILTSINDLAIMLSD
jgi:tetratricopeptide (TPR) repeat protein